jgi:hypothetical protein
MLTATLALALTLAPAQSDPVTFKWKLNEGDVFYAKTVMTQNQTMGFMGQKLDFTIEISNVARYTVKSAKAGTTVVEITFVQSGIDAKGLPIPLLGDVGDKLKGTTLTATLNDKFEATKLAGYDKFLDKLGGGDDANRKMMQAIFPEASVREIVTQAFPPVPDKPVKVGDTWTRADKASLGGLGNVASKSTFKLDSADAGLAKVSMKGDLTFKPGDGGDTGLPFKITKADLKTDRFTGTSVIDLKAGRLKESKSEMAMSGTMTIGAGGQEIEATLKQKTTTTTTVTDKNPVRD